MHPTRQHAMVVQARGSNRQRGAACRCAGPNDGEPIAQAYPAIHPRREHDPWASSHGFGRQTSIKGVPATVRTAFGGLLAESPRRCGAQTLRDFSPAVSAQHKQLSRSIVSRPLNANGRETINRPAVSGPARRALPPVAQGFPSRARLRAAVASALLGCSFSAASYSRAASR